MIRSLKFVAIALVALFVAEPAVAQFKPNVRVTLPYLRKVVPPIVKPPLRNVLRLPITPSEATAIAQGHYPGFRVLKLRLKGEVYFITLAGDNNIMKVAISGLDGSLM
jgi:uncharacterized membrane protein YkoI